MKCKKKKLLAMFLALTMSVNLFTTSVWAEEDLAEDNQKSVIVEQTLSSGTCGPNLNWTLSDDGILTISGSGRMDSWSGNWHLQPTPWYENRDSIKEVVIEEGVTSIGGDAFRRCSNLTKIVMPNTLTSIQGYAFDYCSSLKDIDIPEGVTHIYEYTFEDCSSLSNINISASVTDIEKYAFTGCSSLKSIVIPDSVTYIGGNAFNHCSNLTSVTFGSGVSSIGSYIFNECNSLNSINVSENNADYSSKEGILFNKDKTELLIYPLGREGAYVIPAGVTSIADYAFYVCDKLTKVTFPKSLTQIGDYAFSNCYGLTEIDISNVTEIGRFAFAICSNVSSSKFGKNLKSIDQYAFFECTGMKDITFGNAVTNIGYRAFSRCDILSDVYYGGTEENWSAINIASENGKLINATIHYNSEMPDSPDIDNPEPEKISKIVKYFSSWDAENQIVYWGEGDYVGSKVMDETDTSFLENLDNLLNHYVLVETKSRDDGMVDSDYLISIKPVESKKGTVSSADATSIVIDNNTYKVPEWMEMPEIYADRQVLYHVVNGEIVGIEALNAKDGILKEWNADSRELTIIPDDLNAEKTVYRLSNLADDATMKLLETIENDAHIRYVIDSNKFVYRINKYVNVEKVDFKIPNIELGQDTYSFVNSESDIGVKSGKTYPYNKHEWNTYLEKYDFTVGDIASIFEAAESFGGVCAGMSSVFTQNYYNLLMLNDYQDFALSLHDLKKPANNVAVQNLIGLNQYIIAGGSKYTWQQSSFNQEEPLKYLYDLLINIESSKSPIYIDYCWVTDEAKFNTELGTGAAAHAIMAYGIESSTGPYQYDGKDYAYKVLTVDPNYLYSKENRGDENCIYISSDLKEAIIPNSGTTANELGNQALIYNGGKLKDNGDFVFQLITDEIDEIVPRGSAILNNTVDIGIKAASVDINGEYINNFNVTQKEWIKNTSFLPEASDVSEFMLTLDKKQYDINTHGLSNVAIRTKESYEKIKTSTDLAMQWISDSKMYMSTEGDFEVTYTTDEIGNSEKIQKLNIEGNKAKNLTLEVSTNDIRISGDSLNGIKVTTSDIFGENVESIVVNDDRSNIEAIIDSDGIKLEDKNVYVVTFNPLNDTENITIEGIKSGETIQLPPEPKKQGYIFGGWYTEQDGKGDEFTAETIVKDNLIVYAYWIPEDGEDKPDNGGDSEECKHDYSSEWIFDKYNHWHVCKKCEEILMKVPHTYNEGETIHEADCVSGSEIEYTCTECGYEDVKAGKPLGHSFGEWVITKQPTAEEDGVHERVCETCGEKEVEVLDKLSTENKPEKPSSDVDDKKDTNADNGTVETGDTSSVGIAIFGILASSLVLISMFIFKKKRRL